MKRVVFLIGLAIVATAAVVVLVVHGESLAAALSYAVRQMADMPLQNAALLALSLQTTFLAAVLVLWAITSRRNWFWRALPIVGWLLAVRLAHAPELLLLFAGQFLTIAALADIRRRLLRRAARRLALDAADDRRSSSHWQFSLRDVLLTVLLAGLGMPMLSGLHVVEFDDPWSFLLAVAVWIVAGATLGAVCCLAAWTSLGPAKREPLAPAASGLALARQSFASRGWSRFLVALPTAAGLAWLLGLTYFNLRDRVWLSTFSKYERGELAGLLIVTVFGLWIVQTVWLWLWRLSGWQVADRQAADSQSRPVQSPAPPGGPTAPRRRRVLPIAARVLLIGAVLSALPGVMAIWWELARVIPIPPDAPGAEHGARLESIGGQIDWSPLKRRGEDATPDEREQFVQLNASRLAAAHSLLEGPCGTRVDYSGSTSPSASNSGKVTLAESFDEQSRIAAANGDYGTAAIAGLDCFRSGSRGHRGGAVIDKYIEYAIEGVGMARLVDAAPGLDRRQWRLLDAELAEEEHNREPLDDVYARKHALSMSTGGWFDRVEYALLRHLAPQEPAYRADFELRESSRLAQIRLLRTDLAIRFYRQDEGTFPPSLAALVPNWLDAVPLDPFSGRPLAYRGDDERYWLYSVGPNGIDDGGRAVTWPETADDDDRSLENFRLYEVMQSERRAKAAAEAAARAREQADAADTEP